MGHSGPFRYRQRRRHFGHGPVAHRQQVEVGLGQLLRPGRPAAARQPGHFLRPDGVACKDLHQPQAASGYRLSQRFGHIAAADDYDAIQ